MSMADHPGIAVATLYLLIAMTLWHGARAYCPSGLKGSIVSAVIALFWPALLLLYLFLMFVGRRQ
jgi:hypothetical protein